MSSSAPARSRRRFPLMSRVEPWLFLAPFLAGILVFTAYPFVNVVLMSFKEGYNFMDGSFTGVGAGNYAQIFQDPNFLDALRNTGLYVLFVVPLSTVLALAAALLLNSCRRLRGLLQTCYFLPMVTSVIATGLVWKWLFNNEYGLINYALSTLGIVGPNWLNDPVWNLPALVIYGVWSMVPITVILILAGLQGIDPQYAVAARVDGASRGRIFRRITLPLLAPTIGLTAIVNVITASKVFMELFPLFNGKPGSAYSLYTVVYYLYDMFYQKWELGPAAACAIVLFVIVFALTLVQLACQRAWKR